jgi:hypothetical protein
MEMDRFNAYSDALNVVLCAENGSEERKPRGEKTTGAQARAAFDAVFEKAKES